MNACKFLLAVLFGLFLPIATLTGCSGDSGSETTTDPAPDPGSGDSDACTPGFLGCECIDGTACFPGSEWVCVEGTCREPTCELGTEGCACFPNNTCGNDESGDPMLCESGTCSRMTCTPGDMGCSCTEGGLCSEGLECIVYNGEPVCTAPNCKPGAEGCACGEGRECLPGLACAQNTCVPSSCRQGAEDCFCLPDLSCDDGFQCNGDTERCEPIPCTPGSLGCGCDNGTCAGANAFCDQDEICQEADCVAGQEGCACLNGTECAATADGSLLFCEDGRCRQDDCTPGDAGCACIDGFQCSAGNVCSDGACIPEDCTPGAENCICGAGNCQPGLRCREDNLCVDGTGHFLGACFEDGSCTRGNRCTNEICIRCTLGTPGCACDDGDACFTGAVCIAGTCIAESDIPPVTPENPSCYTPCSEGLVNGDTYMSCGPADLIEGCIGGRTCVDGQCLLPGEDPRTCESPLDCPFWQTCIGGTCYSECDVHDDCADGKSCFQHVCRSACDSTENFCPEGQQCLTTDAENGFCIPSPALEDEPVREVIGNFEINKLSLEMNNTKITSSFQIRNLSPIYQTFTVRKMDHQLSFADGTGSRAVRVYDGQIDGCDPEGDEPCFCSEDSECIDADYQCRSGACRPAICTEGTCPMSWLTFASGLDEAELAEEIEVGIDAGAGLTIYVGDAANTNAVRWQGRLEISNPQLGKQQVDITYNEVPQGQWAGEMVYFANFGDANLQDWLDLPNPEAGSTPSAWAGTRNDFDAIELIGNALLRKWGGFRLGRTSYDKLQAVLTATRTGSWKYANVQENCDFEACFQYDANRSGLEVYSSSLESAPIPTGVTEMPFAVNLHIPDPDNPHILEGRIETSKALQYPGNPSLTMTLANDPSECSLEVGGQCVVFVESFNAEMLVGGRYQTVPNDMDCSAKRPGDSYVQAQLPWLVTGFTNGTTQDSETGLRYRYECRDSLLPFYEEDPDLQAEFSSTNQSLTASNPIPDGRARRRNLRLLDGALINQSQLIVLFEERFESFLGESDTEGFSAYGYMVLKRKASDLDETDTNPANGIPDVFEGATPTDDRTEPSNVLAPICSDDILQEVLGRTGTIRTEDVARLTKTLIDGIPEGTYAQLGASSDEQVHYLCEDTGLFDGGSQNNTPNGRFDLVPNDNSCSGLSNNGVCEDGGLNSSFSICELGTDLSDCGQRQNSELNQRIECPAGSKVTFFTVYSSSMSQAEIAALPCQQDGTCMATYLNWKSSSWPIVQEDPVYRCTSTDQSYCDRDRQDLRQGKTFYAAGQEGPVFTDLKILIDQAFRYKSRFQNREGQGVGFAPEICIPDSDLNPYCYDPNQIEEIQARIDCLLHIHQNYYDVLNDAGDAAALRSRTKLDDYLVHNFSTEQEIRDDISIPIVHDGFERQFAQLLIMLGDESFTRAFSSRFDLAQNNIASFEGSRFEDEGIDLSGALGFEMYSLYQAAQYYQYTLDRFYTMSPVFWNALGYPTDSPQNFMTPETVTSYFDRVVRASTQKARAWGEIAKRYQSLGRPDLARRVAERAYAATYMESIVMSRMMLRTQDNSVIQDRPQILRAVEDAQLRYRTSLLDMFNVHSAIDDNITVFGFDPDYIPFPALDREDYRQSNAFEVLLLRARNKIQFAREREELALNSNREFETDQAQFQAELTQIRNNYEGQLGELCGTFEGPDERIYPAIKKYAYLDQTATLLGDPCGFMGNGQIHDIMASFEELEIDARALKVSIQNVVDEIEIEQDRVSAQCGEILEAANFLYGACPDGPGSETLDFFQDPFKDPSEGGCLQAQINDLQRDVRISQFAVSRLQTAQSVLATVAGLTKCTAGLSTDCPTAAVSLTTFLVGTALTEAAIGVTESTIISRETQIDDLERMKMKWQTENECDLAKVESEARVRNTLLRLRELDLESLRLEHRMKLGLSELERQRNQAKRLQIEQEETERLTINVQAAHNDPNVRIYKNDAIINAEIAFDDAIREIYKLTRVFEYYTSTTYSQKNDLFLIRMVARGDKNLENYLSEIENSFYEFEELFGHPATRVHIVSLKNDIFNIPRTDEEGKALSESERTREMRNRLTDVALLDKNGYLTVPFSTNLGDVSPLTRNHKIQHVEIDVFGNDTGDFIGRMYLRQKGTSSIRSVEDERQFYRFDEKTAVVNTIFGGVRYFDGGIYQNYRLRDRPFVNTNWELVINQRDEEANQDINLVSLDDVRIYIYYSDFTIF